MVVKRPTGHKIINQSIAASVIEDYVGDAIVQFPYHGLGTGDTVYIESDIDEYNGFWYVTAVDANQFKISEHSEADFVEYYQDADIDYYQTQEHDWSSIFLPIVYKITNTFWPTNTQDAVRTVSSFSDDNGFTSLILSGPLKGSFKALEFVKVGTEVYQIVEVITTSEIVINLPYATDLTFSTVQYYYNNYQTRVKIYAGLPASHPWEPKKPFTEVSELSLTPDSNNEVMFSVSDYITQKVAIKNNILLFSLPLNLDAFTAFYISTGESYDQSDNYSLGTTEVLYTDDSFTGYAVAGKLPFKNMYSGDYADYVYTSGYPALWLTLFDRLFAVHGLYFDVSFIKNLIGDFHVSVVKTASDYSITEQLNFIDQGIGVYRVPLTIDSAYDSYCITAVTEDRTEEQEVFPEDDDLSVYTQTAFGPDEYDWTIGPTLSVAMLDDFTSEIVGRAMVVLSAATLKVNYDITINFTNTIPLPVTIRITFYLDTSFASTDDNTQLNYSVPIIGSGMVNLTGQLSILATSNRNFFDIVALTGADEATIVINSLSFGDPTTEMVNIPGVAVTEEICIDIIDDCQAADQFVADNIRELEDGNYRLLE